jgi:hypothetical protein
VFEIQVVVIDLDTRLLPLPIRRTADGQYLVPSFVIVPLQAVHAGCFALFKLASGSRQTRDEERKGLAFPELPGLYL